MLYVDNNPCFPENSPELREKLLGKLSIMDKLNAPLSYLNGYEITIKERVKT
jgi:hypothetical protein